MSLPLLLEPRGGASASGMVSRDQVCPLQLVLIRRTAASAQAQIAQGCSVAAGIWSGLYALRKRRLCLHKMHHRGRDRGLCTASGCQDFVLGLLCTDRKAMSQINASWSWCKASCMSSSQDRGQKLVVGMQAPCCMFLSGTTSCSPTVMQTLVAHA